MTSKTFTVVGITTHGNSDSKVRFTHDLVRRVKQFSKGGATLPNEMNKVDALNYMLTRPEFASPADQATIKESLYDRVPTTPKVKVKATTKPSLDAIKSRVRKATTAQDVLEAVAG